MARVLISAGHTQMDPGAIFGDLREADLTRKIAAQIIPHIEKAKVEVKAVPLDMPLFQRLEWINATGYTADAGDILVEVHINDSDGSKRGIEAWYEGEGKNNSQKLALSLMHTMCDDNRYSSQKARSEFEHELGMLTFLNRSNPAAVIIETLFIDNEQDAKLLKDEQETAEIAKRLAGGILMYLGLDQSGKQLPPTGRPKLAVLLDKYASKQESAPAKATGFTSSTTPEATIPPVSTLSPVMPSMPNLGSMPTFGGGSIMQDRDARSDMIKKTYLRILGREPNSSDLNYFINRGISKAELEQKMVDSQEHAELVKAKSELSELQAEHDKLQQQITRLQTGLQDMKGLLDELNKSLTHKNSAIRELQELAYTQAKPGQSGVGDQAKSRQITSTSKSQSVVKLERPLVERVFNFIGKRLS